MIPRVLVNGLLQADWFEPIAVHVNGLPFTAEGSLAVAIDATVDHVHNGIPFDADGRVCVEEGSASYHLAGRAYTASNRLLVDIFGTQANALAGLPLTSAGALAVEMFASATFALDFARDQYSTLSPALTVSSPTGGVMVPDYLGNYHKTLAGEIPIRGGRRLYNLRSADLTANPGTQANRTVDDAAKTVTLSSANASFSYWRTTTGSQPAGSKWFFRAKISCPDGERTIGFRATSSSGGTDAEQVITVDETPREFSLALTISVDGTPEFGLDNRSGVVAGTDTDAGTFTFEDPCIYEARPGQTVIDPEYVSRGVLSSPYHGYGVDGLAWMRTDPSGLALADAASGYPVLCTGIADWPTLTNRLTYNQDASQWTKRGAATCTFADDGTVEGGYFELRGLGAGSTDDVYRYVSGFTTDADVGLALLIRPVDTSGTLRIQNAANDQKGRWDVDLSTLTPGAWNLVNRSHAGITVVSEFLGVSGTAGPQFVSPAGSVDVDVAVPTMLDGTLYCPVVIPTAATAVTADAIVKTLDDSLIGWVAGGGTLIVEQTPEQDASTGDILIDIKTDADNRILVSGAGGNTQLLVRDGASDVATINGTGWQAGVTQRVAAKIEANDAELVIDGSSEGTDTSLTVPAITTITLGGGQAKSIGAIAYYAAGA